MNQLTHNKAMNQFIIQLENDQKAFVEYEIINDKYFLTYSEVPVELRGQGIGKELVEKTFEMIEKEGKHAKAICGYIKVIARRSEKWKNIIEY